MWIMLTKKLPTAPSPPKLSFHWAEPWPDGQTSKLHEKLKKYLKNHGGFFNEWELQRFMNEHHTAVNSYCEAQKVFYDMWGKTPDWSEALGFFFMGERIRVFPHEYNAKASMRMYMEEKALILHEDVGVKAVHAVLSAAKKIIYEQALLDGCNEFQAELVAMGKDPFEGEIAPTGWYEMHPDLASIYCHDWEMAITPPPTADDMVLLNDKDIE